MHAAKLETSSRLQLVDALLADGREHTTREIMAYTGTLAINSCVAELRVNGRKIDCTQRGRRFYYRRTDLDGLDNLPSILRPQAE